MNAIALTSDTYKKLILDINGSVKRPFIIAIDGRCTSGKTTLASKLEKDLNASILHMDDFFLRIEQRTKERYEEPGGNVDRERVSDVIESYLKDKKIEYRPFSCKIWGLDNVKTIPYHDILIVEGSYSMHPELMKYYDYKILMTIDSNKQLDRVLIRNGLQKLEDFKTKWIPLEEKYFEKYDLEDKVDVVLDTTEGEL